MPYVYRTATIPAEELTEYSYIAVNGRLLQIHEISYSDFHIHTRCEETWYEWEYREMVPCHQAMHGETLGEARRIAALENLRVAKAAYA